MQKNIKLAENIQTRVIRYNIRTTTTNSMMQTTENRYIQQPTRIRKCRRARMFTMSLALLVSCIAIGQCLAFHISNPYSNRAFGRLHATTEEDISSSSTPPIQTFDRQHFEMQVGVAMDTLRGDYPDFLHLKHPGKHIKGIDCDTQCNVNFTGNSLVLTLSSIQITQSIIQI